MYSDEFLNRMRAAQSEWESRHAREFRAEHPQALENDSGIPFKRLYTPIDLVEKGSDDLYDPALPG